MMYAKLFLVHPKLTLHYWFENYAGVQGGFVKRWILQGGRVTTGSSGGFYNQQGYTI